MKTKKSTSRKHKDCIFTKPATVSICLDALERAIPHYKSLTIVEPSAGDGRFLNQLPVSTIALDIDPKDTRITKQDWFNFNKDLSNAIVIGNPPFGTQNKLSIKFFNHAASLNSKYIAFVIPKSWQNYSIISKLDKHYHLLSQTELPLDSFTLDGKDYLFKKIKGSNELFSIKCIFVIYERLEELRVDVKPQTHHEDFEMISVRQSNLTKQQLQDIINEYPLSTRRSGYYTDYRIDKSNTQTYNSDFLFFKPKNQEVYDRLMKIDMFKLSREYQSIPTINMWQVVREYFSIKLGE